MDFLMINVVFRAEASSKSIQLTLQMNMERFVLSYPDQQIIDHVLSLKNKYYPSKFLIRITLYWLSFSSMNWQFERLTSKDISKTAEKLIAVQAHRSNEY